MALAKYNYDTYFDGASPLYTPYTGSVMDFQYATNPFSQQRKAYGDLAEQTLGKHHGDEWDRRYDDFAQEAQKQDFMRYTKDNLALAKQASWYPLYEKYGSVAVNNAIKQGTIGQSQYNDLTPAWQQFLSEQSDRQQQGSYPLLDLAVNGLIGTVGAVTGGGLATMAGAGSTMAGAVGGATGSGVTSNFDPSAMLTGAVTGGALGAANPDAFNYATTPHTTLAEAGSTTAAAGGSVGSDSMFNNTPQSTGGLEDTIGGLNPNINGDIGLNPNVPTGVGLNGGQVGLPVTTSGDAFNNTLGSGLQNALSGTSNSITSLPTNTPLFNNTPGADATGGLNPNITSDTPGLNANTTGGTGLNTAAGGEAFNSGLSPELQGVLNNPATQTGAVGAGGGILDQIGQVGQGAGQIGDLINQLTNGESGGTPTNQQQQNGQYNLPWQFLLGSILPMMMAGRGNEASWNQAWNDTLNSDPWRAEQGKYMPLLLDAAQHGIGNTDYGRSIASSVARQDSAKGYNMSGNMATDIAGSLNNGTAQYMQALSPLAMGRAPDTRGLANIAQGRAQANDQQWGAIMSGLGSIFSGTPQNNNNFSLSGLYDSLRNSLPSLG